MQMYGYYIWNEQCIKKSNCGSNQNCNVTTPLVFCFYTEIKAAI